ncbi:MAG: PTS system mannose/fructose/sorbose family transporter subunit IID [Thermofilum sp.]
MPAAIGPVEVGLLGLLAFIFGLDYIWVTPLGIWRPVVAGTITGIILGDPITGLVVGSLLEFVFAGLFTIGGGTVPEAASGTIAATVLAITMGLRPEAAVPLAIPIAVLTMNIEIMVRSFDAVFTHWADREIERGNFGAIPMINILGAVPWGLSRAIPIWGFVGLLAVNPEAVKAAIEAIQVIHIGPLAIRFWDAMAVAGAVLPALGAAIMMKMMLSRRNVMFFVLGFALAAYLKLSLVAIALIVGAIVAAIYYYVFRDVLEATPASSGAPLTGKATTRDFLRWFAVSWFIQSSWNYERMMGTGFAHGMLEIEKKLRKDPEELKSWLRLHNEFYNTEPHLHNAIYGMAISLEEQGADQDTIRGIKTALMGPFAGLGDSVMWFTLLPIAFLLGASLGVQRNLLGPVVALAIWIPVSWAVKYYTLVYGYKYGLSLAEILRGEFLKVARDAIMAFAMAIIGGIAATYVRATTPIVLAAYAGQQIKLQPILDQFMPSLLPLLFTLYAYWLIKNKGYSYGKAVIILFLTAFILALIGVLG